MRQAIIQAGGKGTRLEHFTWNKPKCLVPIDGKPLLYDLLDRLRGYSAVVIVDYHADIVRRYIDVFPPPVPVSLVQASGSGTNAGIAAAMARLPYPDEPFLLIWCDLRFETKPVLPDSDAILVGTTDTLPCRWTLDPVRGLLEERSERGGVLGLFAIPHRDLLASLPADGEFVAALRECAAPVAALPMEGVAEFGTVATLTQHWTGRGHARCFNQVRLDADRVIKSACDPAYAGLIADEIAWYREAARLGFGNMPELLCESPFTLRRVAGAHPFDFARDRKGRTRVLTGIIDMLERLHACADAPADAACVAEVYEAKTFARLASVARLIPDITSRETLRINGRLCRNLLHPTHRGLVADLLDDLAPPRFAFIHGDPTFSNILIDAAETPWLIDPRGRFGASRFLGDPLYDWAKLTYSVDGDYDCFNRRQFILELYGHDVELQINTAGWRHLGGLLAEHLGRARMGRLRVLHGLIWLSLSGYVTDDYDSILGAYFKGLSVLEDALCTA
jgi:hypothetical protein